MRYCRYLHLPDTRPGLVLDGDNVSNTYRFAQAKREVDWHKRQTLFADIVRRVKSVGADYDCIVPVSGGKDSHWQVLKCLEYNMKVLAITWRSPGRNELGQRNLDNLINLGVDHIDYTVNPRLESKLMWAAFERFGSHAIPMHMGIFNITHRLAAQLGIPLVVWGENSATEYGGDEKDAQAFRITAEWVHRYGAMNQTTLQDWIHLGFTERELKSYRAPEADEHGHYPFDGVFLAHFFPWDVEVTKNAALKHGFTTRTSGPITGLYDYADIDDDLIAIHHWMKWYKFGFTRLWDNVALEIKNGRMSSEDGKDFIQRHPELPPLDAIRKFCEFTGKSVVDFESVTEKFRNPAIWRKIGDVWEIEDFLFSDWRWNEYSIK